MANLNEALPDSGSGDQVWDEHVGATLLAMPGTEAGRDAAVRDIGDGMPAAGGA